MLSKEACDKARKLWHLYHELNEMIAEETGDKYNLCVPPRLQFYANYEHKHSVKELEDLVGPLTLHYNDRLHRAKHYHFSFGATPCVIVLPNAITKPDSQELDA